MATRTNNQLISVREAARECGRNMETIRRWIWGGKLPAQKLGNQLFIKRSDLASYCRLPARSAPAKVGETTVRYDAGRRLHVIKQLRRLRERIRARIGRDFTEDEVVSTIEEMRQERMNELSGLR